MRKIKILAFMALALCACNKINEIEEQPVVPAGPNTVTFTAEFTKTSIDANDEVVSWSAGDKVKFVWAGGGSATATASSSGASTSFTVEVAAGITEVYAVYPAAAAGSYSDGKVNVNFAASRTSGSFAANDICVAKAVKTAGVWNTTLSFKNVACLMKVNVTSSDITRLQVMAVGGEAISGLLPVSIDGSGNVSTGTPSSTGSTVNMTVSATGDYYIPVIPGVTLSKGFRINRFEGDTQVIPFFYNGAFETTRGKIFKFKNLDAHAGHYYVTLSGAGTKSGQSWSNAMNADSFKSFIQNSDNYFLLRNATIHLSAETFTFGDYLQPDFSNHSEVAFTIEGIDDGENITTFVGSTGDPAGTLWPKESCNLTVKNVKFTGTRGYSNRAAIRMNTTSAKLTLENCIFQGNNTAGNGGAIVVFRASQLNINDCKFYGNYGNGGSCLFIKLQTDLTVNVTGGIFKGNYAVGTGDYDSAGAVFYAANDGGMPTLNFSNVSFEKNYNYVGTNGLIGGILRLQAENAKAYFNKCVFDGNYTNRENNQNPPCAAIVNCRVNGVKYYFNACEFKENTSGTGNSAGVYGGLRGTVFATLKSSTFAFNNCSFHDNYGGRNTNDITWIGMDNPNSTLILANTTIVGDNVKPDGTVVSNYGVIKFQNTGNYYLLNTILCSLDGDSKPGNCFWVNEKIAVDGVTTIEDGGPKLPVYCWYSKISKEGDNRTNWTEDTGSGHDYYATTASFGSWKMPYTWNGTLTGTNSSMKAATSDVNTQIQSADADFYAWLNSIGALGKDINGKSRGATSWPGCYQK